MPIVKKAKDHIIPEAFWIKVLETKPNVFGVAFTEDGVVGLQGGSIDQLDDPLKSFQEVQEAYSGHEMLFWLDKFPEGYSEDDIQPYILNAAENANVYLAVFIQGDYKNFSHPGSTRRDEFFAIENTVQSSVDELIELTDGDMERISKALGNPARKQAFENACASEGTIIVVCGNGDIHSYVKDPKQKSGLFEWGETTDTCGYSEGTFPEKETEAEKESEKPPNKLAALLGKKKEIKGSPPPAPVQKTEAKKEEKVGETTIIRAGSVPPVTQKMVKWDVPKEWSNKMRKQIIQHSLGMLPPDWKTRTEITCPENKVPRKVTSVVVKDFKEMGEQLKNGTATQTIQEKTAEKVANTELPKTVATEKLSGMAKLAAIEQAREDSKEPQHVHIDGFVPAGQLKDFKEKFLGSVAIKDLLGKPVPSLEEVQELERKIPTWSEKTGLDTEKAWNWPDTSLTILVQQYPDLAKLLIKAYRMSDIKLKTMLNKQKLEQPATTPVKTKTIKMGKVA